MRNHTHLKIGVAIWAALTGVCWIATVHAAQAPPPIRMGTRSNEVLLTKITVTDLRRSYDFYTQILGLKRIEVPGVATPSIDEPTGPFVEILLNFSASLADPFLGLIKQSGAMPTPPAAQLTWIGLKTSDVRATVERAKAAGVVVLLNATEVQGFLTALLRDPDGYTVELVQAQNVATRSQN